MENTQVRPGQQTVNSPLLPDFVFSTEEGLEEQKKIVRDLFFRYQDTRSARVFRAVCKYAEKQKKNELNYASMFRQILNKGDTLITVEVNLKTVLTEVLSALEKNNYISQHYSEENRETPEFILLHDPIIEKIKIFYRDFFAVNQDYFLHKSQLLNALTFPNTEYLVTKFNINPMKLENTTSKLSPHLFLPKHVDDLADGRPFYQVDFKESRDQPISVILPKTLDIDKLIKHIIVPLLFHVMDKNPRLKDEVQSVLTTFPGMQDEDIDSIRSDRYNFLQDKVYYWVDAFKQVSLRSDMRENPARYLSKSFMTTAGGASKNLPYLTQAVCLLQHYIFNLQENEKQKAQASENESKDYLQIAHYLIEDCKHVEYYEDSYDVNTPELEYYPVTLEMIGKQKDVSGRTIMMEKYGESALHKLLIRNPNKDTIPKIVSLDINDQVVYLHRWRLIDIFFTEVRKERLRMHHKIVYDWARMKKSELPNQEQFSLDERFLSPFFKELLFFVKNVCAAFLEIQELQKILFPSTLDVSPYKLSNSNLINPPEVQTKKGKQVITSEQKIIYFKELVYESLTGIESRPLHDILGLDYLELLRSAKNERKRLRSRNPENKERLQFDTFLDELFYDIVNGIAYFFYKLLVLLGLRKDKQSTSWGNSRSEGKKKKEGQKAELYEVSAVFNVPTNRTLLEDQLLKSLNDWNQIFLEPRSQIENWDSLNFQEREQKKRILKNETELRMKDSKVRVDGAIKKIYTNFDLKDVSDEHLTAMCEKTARRFTDRNVTALTRYIKLLIILLNTK